MARRSDSALMDGRGRRLTYLAGAFALVVGLLVGYGPLSPLAAPNADDQGMASHAASDRDERVHRDRTGQMGTGACYRPIDDGGACATYRDGDDAAWSLGLTHEAIAAELVLSWEADTRATEQLSFSIETSEATDHPATGSSPLSLTISDPLEPGTAEVRAWAGTSDRDARFYTQEEVQLDATFTIEAG